MIDDNYDEEVRGDHNGHDAPELGSMCGETFIPHKDTDHIRNISVAMLAGVALVAGIIVFKSHHHAGLNM